MPEWSGRRAGTATLIRGEADRSQGAAAMLALGSPSAQAGTLSETLGLHHLDVYFDAFADINRSDLVAMALTLGVLLFAVVSAITLVRTRLRAASADAAFRDEIMTLKAERDRFNALLISEPQILVSWEAADNDRTFSRHHACDQRSHAATRAGVRLLARAGQGAGHGACGRCAARRGRRFLDAS